MMPDEEKIPPFIQDYLNKMEYEGYSDFVKLSRDYHKAREEYPGKFATQAAHRANYNRATGQNKSLNYDDGLKRIDADYKNQAYKTAQKHGFKAPDPNKPHDAEFTKQGQKFSDMIDNARQRKRNAEPQPEAKQEQKTERGKETEKIDDLKQQQSDQYQQDAPKVTFKGVEPNQSQAESKTEKSPEELREAFLEQMRKTKEQQMQRQNDKQQEI